MKILGEIVRIADATCLVPWFHRVAPSLKTGTTIFGVFPPDAAPEIFLSPYRAGSWTDLWRLDFEFHDKPGLLSQLTTLLKQHSVLVNILAHESATIDNVFSVTLICDMSDYGEPGNPDGTSSDRANNELAELRFLCDYILIELFDDLKFRNGQPQIHANRLRVLSRVGRLLRHPNQLPEFQARVVHGKLEVDERSENLWIRQWQQFLESCKQDSEGHCLVSIMSDTEERFVKVTALPKDRDVLLMSVRHTDRPGQIARFTSLLAKSFDQEVNIHCSYLRLISASREAEWRCLLDVPDGTAIVHRQRLEEYFEKTNEDH